jgi:hypothetical protein
VKGTPGKVVDSLHEEVRDSSRMNLSKSNREGDGEKRTGQMNRQQPQPNECTAT